ncbi:hypothetical protein ES702_04378 [subsurface metagenome]
MIISKGQGNYETLSGEDKAIFFLLKAKCPVIAKDLGCKAGDIVLKGQITNPVSNQKMDERSVLGYCRVESAKEDQK